MNWLEKMPRYLLPCCRKSSRANGRRLAFLTVGMVVLQNVSFRSFVIKYRDKLCRFYIIDCQTNMNKKNKSVMKFPITLLFFVFIMDFILLFGTVFIRVWIIVSIKIIHSLIIIPYTLHIDSDGEILVDIVLDACT